MREDDLDEAEAAEEEEHERVRQALAELAELSPRAAEDVVIELLEAVENGDLPLSSVLGYTDDDLYTLYEKAYNFYKGGRPKNAAIICEALLALNPGLPAAMLLLAGALMDLKLFDRALQQIDAVLEVDEADLEAQLKRAHVLFRLGRLDECADALDRLLELDPECASEEAQEAARIFEHVRTLLES